MPSNHPILCRPLLLLPSIFPNIRIFSNESALRIRWPKYWSFSFNIIPSNEHPGLICFRMDYWSPCCPRDSQDSSPAPQFESINSSALSLFYVPISYNSVQFSCSVVFDSLRPHELQYTRPPCPSPTPGVYLNSCPLSLWCHPTILSSVVPFASCPQSFPASGSFQMSQSFASGGQRLISFPIFATPKFATPRNSKSFPLSCHLSTKIIFLH